MGRREEGFSAGELHEQIYPLERSLLNGCGGEIIGLRVEAETPGQVAGAEFLIGRGIV